MKHMSYEKEYIYAYDLDYAIFKQKSMYNRISIQNRLTMTQEMMVELKYQNELLKCSLSPMKYTEILSLREKIIKELSKSNINGLNSMYRSLLLERLQKIEETVEKKRPKSKKKSVSSMVGSIYNTGHFLSYKKYGEGIKAHKF